MGNPEEKIRALVNRALGTDSEEEARTSALLAIKLAAKSGAVIRVRRRESSKEDPATYETHVECEDAPKPAQARKSPAPRTGASFVVTMAKGPGSCKHCGKRWEAGEVIAQRPGEKRAYHSGCAAARR